MENIKSHKTSLLLHELFEKQAKLFPDNTALVFENKSISYAGLNERSEILASLLIHNCVKSGDIVNICIDRSIEMIVGILGILKCGAAYLPIDPKTPSKRLDYIFNDSSGQILVTSTTCLEKISSQYIPSKVLCIDSEFEVINHCHTNQSRPSIGIDQPAVILYTSGTTGHPKGVVLSHKSLVNRLLWDNNTYLHTHQDIVLQHASYNFDFSILEIFMALSNAAKLILARNDFHYESYYLIDLIQKEGITKMGSVPSLLKIYLKYPGFKNCTTLKQVFLGGEVLDYQLQQLFFENSNARLINIYGPTETSISVLHWECKRNCNNNIIPIGYPVADMRIYILNENLEMVSDGEEGEIYISGTGNAIGYYNQPKLTGERFLSDPFYLSENVTMYKTGDLGKKLPNAAIQFIGRNDFQVKIHGLRIELNEIEFWLKNHPDIKECVVRGFKYDNSEMKLVAYLIPNCNSKLNMLEIKEYLYEKLPDYMVPGLYIQLDKFPLSSNGKINRQELPEPDKMRLLMNTTYVQPVSHIQKELIRIWEKVLLYKPIGLYDSFDFLGGDSLSAMEIFTLMETELVLRLPISLFSKANNIFEQSHIIESNQNELVDSEIVVLNKGHKNKTPIVIIQGVQGTNIELARSMSKYLDKSYPLYLARPLGVNKKDIPDSIEECASIYVQAIENLTDASAFILGGYSMGGFVALEMGLLLARKGKKIKFTYLIDTYHPQIIQTLLGKNKLFKNIYSCFYMIFSNDYSDKKDIIPTIFNEIKRQFLSLITNSGILSVIKKNEIRPIKNQVDPDDKNVSLALKFNVKQYDGKILLFSAIESSISSTYVDLQNKLSGVKWKKHFKGSYSQFILPANHITIKSEPNVEKISRIINESLKEI